MRQFNDITGVEQFKKKFFQIFCKKILNVKKKLVKKDNLKKNSTTLQGLNNFLNFGVYNTKEPHYLIRHHAQSTRIIRNRNNKKNSAKSLRSRNENQ